MSARVSKRIRRVSSSSSSSESDNGAEKLFRQTDTSSTQRSLLKCSLPPGCNLQPRTFASLAEFESHYTVHHSHRCISCLANFPSDKWLQLHLTEVHDPLWRIKRDRGDKVYACFEDGCVDMRATQSARRRHLVAQHAYPLEFRFNLVNKGIPRNAISLLHDPVKQFPWRKARNKSGKQQTNVDASVNGDESMNKGESVKSVDGHVKTGVMTRAQRRAQARLEKESAANKDDVSMTEHAQTRDETTFKDVNERIDKDVEKNKTSKKSGKAKNKPPNSKQVHAEAVRALLQGLEDPDTLEPSQIDQEDAEMNDLSSVMTRSHLVPSRIRFGH